MAQSTIISPSTMRAVRESGAMAQSEYLLEVLDVRKEFPGVVALDNVRFQLKPGSVHALMGENGAGKSTLMKIIAGVYTPDQGQFKLRGQNIRLKTPLDALENGIAMIHQELNLMAPMSIAENIWIGREPLNRFGFVRHSEMERRTRALFEKLDIQLDPRASIASLSVANRQMVEIAKAVSFGSDVLIMDEPTSALTEKEVAHLFKIISALRDEGKGIVYITHKMNELYEIADQVSVFRDGKYIKTCDMADVTRDDIIKMMVGREITHMFPKQIVPIGDIVLSVENLGLKGVFRDISFHVRAGEILGFAGLVGSGRSNVAETLFGVTPAHFGQISIDGKGVDIKSPADAMRHGMAFLTEDRKETGCFLPLGIQENAEMAVLRNRYVRHGFVAKNRLHHDAAEMANRLRVRTPDMHEPIMNLSGGNQQKVLICRWLMTGPRILILDEPTRGIDVGAKAEIHRLICELARQGVAIIMISSEMPEVLGMSDRIAVLHEGRLTGILDRKDADQVKIMELAAR